MSGARHPPIPPPIVAPGIGEIAPTSGLPPRWRDLLSPARGLTLEQAICERYGFDGIEIVASGTAALAIAFTYLKQHSHGRDVVIVPGYTCPLVVLAVHAAGLRAVACDTVAGGFDLDPGHLAQLLNDRTLAVVPTHYGGALTDVDEVIRIVHAASRDIAIVEDAAQAFGATRHGQSAGRAGDIGVFSFGAGKGFTIYEGGALVARDLETLQGLRNAASRMTRTARLGEIGRGVMLAGYHLVYNPLGLRAAYGVPKRRALARDDEIGAAGDRFSPDVAITHVGDRRKAVGRAALPRLGPHLEQNRARFVSIAERLRELPGVKVHIPRPGEQPTATFLFATLSERAERAATIRALWRSRLGVAKLFTRAIGDYPDMKPLLIPSQTPNARALAAGTITISTAAGASPEVETIIVETLNRFARS